MLDLLDGLPVLDLADHRGEMTAWLLGCLGADVVKVEPPAGCPGRREGPTPRAGGDSLQFEAYNHDKRSVMLDPADPSSTERLRELVAASAIVVDTGPVGRLQEYGLDAAWISSLDVPVVYLQVTPFGSDGPRAEQASSELTIAALGGPLRLQGSPQRPPVPVSVPQVWRHASAEAAVAALVAHRVAVATGTPQVVDVSAQCAMTWTMLNAMEASEIQGHDFERTGATLELAMTVDLRHPASDGHVVVVPRGPTILGLLPAMLADGIVDASWAEEDWPSWDQRSIDGSSSGFTMADLNQAIDRFCSRYTKLELLERGRELGVTMAPINTTADLVQFDHLDARGYWVDRPSGRGPGMFLTVDGTRGSNPGPVPALGQHTEEVLSETDERRARSARRWVNPPAIPGQAAPGLPLAGVRVADFSWIGVGPITAKGLADHGATVVRVESANRIDGLRVQPPFKDGEFGLNRSNFFGPFNTSKLGLSLDLKTDGGLIVARRLVEWADVIIDSFTPGVMAGLGLGPDDIRAVNPAAITLTTSLLGSGGPHSSMAGYGYHAAALAGFFNLVGYPDGPPEGPWLAYTDTIAPRFLTPAVLAALDRRSRTGTGCHIEAAQLEIALQLLAPELLALADHGAVAERLGSRDARFAPQGVYPCEGVDCWAAVTVSDDDVWRRFCEALDRKDWAVDPELASLAGRHARHDELDAGIAAWTSVRSESAVERALADAGVPAAKVQRSSDLAADPQYRHRGFYRTLHHTEVGPIPYAGHQYRISGYPTLHRDDGHQGSFNGPRSAAPMLGEHTFDILTELLGFNLDEVAEIAASGALE